MLFRSSWSIPGKWRVRLEADPGCSTASRGVSVGSRLLPPARGRDTLGGMTPVLYPLSSSTVPRAGVIEVPCYVVRSFNGRTALLSPEDRWVAFDFASLTERDFELATGERGEEWTIQALIAVDVDWLVGVMEAASRNQRTLGVELDDVWYYVSPINLEPAVVAERYVVVGLYR